MKDFILMLYLLNPATGDILDSWPVEGKPIYTTIEQCLKARTEMPPQKNEDGKVYIYGCRTTIPHKNPNQTEL